MNRLLYNENLQNVIQTNIYYFDERRGNNVGRKRTAHYSNHVRRVKWSRIRAAKIRSLGLLTKIGAGGEGGARRKRDSRGRSTAHDDGRGRHGTTHLRKEESRVDGGEGGGATD